jgi:hypothetical protein
MLPRLRLQLTMLYAGAALLLLVSSGTGVYWIIARYFADVTDLALAHQMAYLNGARPGQFVGKAFALR